MVFKSEAMSLFASLALHGVVAVGFYDGWLPLSTIAIEGGSGSVQVEFVPSEAFAVERSSPVAAQPTVSAPLISASEMVLPTVRPVVPRAVRRPAPRPPVARAMLQPTDPCAGGACRGGSGGGNTSGAGNGVPPGQGLTALRTPKPPYPWAARREGFQGRVVLDVVVAADGHVRDVWVQRSSGRPDCDRAALETVRDEWAFKPMTMAGIPMESRSRIVVVYELENS